MTAAQRTPGLAVPTVLAALLGGAGLLAVALVAGYAVQPPPAPAPRVPDVAPPAPALVEPTPVPTTELGPRLVR